MTLPTPAIVNVRNAMLRRLVATLDRTPLDRDPFDVPRDSLLLVSYLDPSREW